MPSTHLRESLEHAYYLHLEGHDFRDAMVHAGVEALLEGVEGQGLTRLAGADNDDDDELMRAFRAAVRELGIDLPTETEEKVWRVRRTETLESDGRGVRPRTPERIFEDRIFLISRRLAERSPSPEVGAFLRHLERRGNAYHVWLDELARIAAPVTASDPGVIARVVAGLVNVLEAQSFGATSQTHLGALSKLLADLDGG